METNKKILGKINTQRCSVTLRDLKLSKFSDIWTINKTHNELLAHEQNASYF